MNDISITIKLAALAIEAQAIGFEVNGMQSANEARKYYNGEPEYTEGSFIIKAFKMREIAEKIKELGRQS